MEAFIFYIFAGLLIASAVSIFFSRDIVRSAVWLLGALGAVAGLLLLLAANFLAAVQLILYVGGVLVLIVFGVMLTAKGPTVRFDVPKRELAAAAVVGLMLTGGVLIALRGSQWSSPQNLTMDRAHAAQLLPTVDIGKAISRTDVVTAATIGEQLLTTYWLPFQLVSVLLLAVMLGAAVLARPRKREKAC